VLSALSIFLFYLGLYPSLELALAIILRETTKRRFILLFIVGPPVDELEEF
jgi:hypothetical protein